MQHSFQTELIWQMERDKKACKALKRIARSNSAFFFYPLFGLFSDIIIRDYSNNT